jgi:hypothetical protein
VVITGAIVALLLTTIVFANDFINGRIAENEFSAIKQFMLTTGLQIDDIAWTVGRTQTVRYSSKFGGVKFQPVALNYTFEVNSSGDWEPAFSNFTGMVMFNMPISEYNLGDNYFERISPYYSSAFLQAGPAAPVSHVFAVEKLPMAEGNYTRIVAVPSIRVLNSTIVGPQQAESTSYFKFYLPTLEPGTSLYRSQSITMTGSAMTKIVKRGVEQVRITVTFPNGGSLGFDADFFKFENLVETRSLPADSVVEFYVGKVIVSFGQI